MGNLFTEFDKFGNRVFLNSNSPDINIVPTNIDSNQTQLAVPHNINTPYSQIIDDDELKPTNASRVTGGRLYDAVCSPFKQSGADFAGPDSIQEALNAGKKRIFIRAGTYIIDKIITIPSDDISIVGESKVNTILKIASGAATNFRIFDTNHCDYLNFENLRFDAGSGDQTNNSIRAFYVYSSLYVSIKSCVFENFDGSGTAEDIIYITNDTSVHSSNIYIINNLFNKTVRACIYLQTNNGNVNILNNLFKDCETGIACYQSSNALIAHNVFDDNDSALFLSGASKCVFNDNKIYDNNQSAINTFPSNEIIISNNFFENIGAYGVLINGGKYWNVIGNIFNGVSSGSNDAYASVRMVSYIGTHSTYNIIKNNICHSLETNKPKYQIWETDANQDYNIISGNILRDYVTDDMLINGANTVVSDNIA